VALDQTTFLGSYGFSENPFILTNADEEPELQSYFVPPPYFPSVIGSPTKPKSSVVFAPRGGGKTAQKVMIEKQSLDLKSSSSSFICITYDSFVFPDKFKITDATAEWHLTNILRLLLISVLVHGQQVNISLKLSDNEKSVIAKTSRNFLSELSEAEFASTLNSIRSPLGKLSDFYDRFKGPVLTLINAFGKKYGLGPINDLVKERDVRKPSIVEYIQTLLRICKTLGFSSVYVLIDRIDEASITQGDSKSSFRFIESLLSDLHVLELSDIAFKFFLWDQVEPHYRRGGSRPDRVPVFRINWTVGELREMLSRRLHAFSNGAVTDLNEIVDSSVNYDLHGMVAVFAAGSPRDMIRMCRAIIDEQTRVNDKSGFLSLSAIEKGILGFSAERSNELFPDIMDELQRVGTNTFTISKLANDVFRMTTQAMGRKIQTWVDAGAVVKSGELPSPGNRPQNLYSFSEPKLSIALKRQRSLSDLMESGMLMCANCETLNLVDSGGNCHKCQNDLSSEMGLTHRFGKGA
jgi:hypothetical protein